MVHIVTKKRIRTEEELNAIRQSWMVGDDGVLRWKRKAIHKNIGDSVGLSSVHGNHRVCFLYFNGKFTGFVESNVVWFLNTGEWPYHEIDHIDNDPTNNKMSNLRAATRSENNFNIGVIKNKNGAKGIFKQPNNKWVVQAWKNKKCYSLGAYDTIEEAIAAREVGIRHLHGEFANNGKRVA